MPIACQGMLVDTLVLVKIIVTKSYIQIKKRNFFVGKQMLKTVSIILTQCSALS